MRMRKVGTAGATFYCCLASEALALLVWAKIGFDDLALFSGDIAGFYEGALFVWPEPCVLFGF